MIEQNKIFIIVPKYKIGGAERVMVSIANELIKYNLKVIFITLTKSNKFILNKKIQLINLESKKVINSVFKLKNMINKHKPDVCFSTISHTNIALYLASKLSKHKSQIFLRESNNLLESINNQNFLYKYIFMKLIKFAYKNANLITPSIELSQKLKKIFQIDKKVNSISNPILIKKSKYNSKKKFDFINIGSLTYQKDHITLLKAFKIANLKNRKLKLIIIGEGNLKKKILEYILNNKLMNDVKILGNSKDINKYLNNSKSFILSSRYEGYPNVLLDAAIAKIPIISTNCKFGPSEILEKGKYGKMFKVGDYFKLSKIMLLNTKIIKKIPNAKLKKNELNLITKKYYELFFKKNI
jgi:glycosyltransferase involved in cell wall biosynthesis